MTICVSQDPTLHVYYVMGYSYVVVMHIINYGAMNGLSKKHTHNLQR